MSYLLRAGGGPEETLMLDQKVRCHNCGLLHKLRMNVGGIVFPGYSYHCPLTGSYRTGFSIRKGKNYVITDEDEWKGWTGDEIVEDAP